VHPFLQAQLAALHNEDLRAAAASARGHAAGSAAGRDSGGAPADVVIRRTTSADGSALAALAALDAAPLPLGPSIVAEVGGVPRAVLPLDDGARAFGDPFAPTSELVALLELRAAQIRRDETSARPHRRAFAWASPAALRRFV
jgi:hypothetical protein